MATDKLGVTVMELFTYNPYRIIGVPVNAPQEKIDLVYQELMIPSLRTDRLSIFLHFRLLREMPSHLQVPIQSFRVTFTVVLLFQRAFMRLIFHMRTFPFRFQTLTATTNF